MTQRDWNNFFWPEDFGARIMSSEGGIFYSEDQQRCADKANSLLREALANAPVVYGAGNDCEWLTYQETYSTHQAKLVQVEKLK